MKYVILKKKVQEDFKKVNWANILIHMATNNNENRYLKCEDISESISVHFPYFNC